MNSLRTLATLAILTSTAVVAIAYAPERLHGKTEAQVLKMGEKKWMDFVADKPGGSTTPGMAEAEAFFASAAHRRNARLMSKLGASRRATLVSLTDALENAGSAILECDSIVTGRGTIYKILHPARDAEVEDTIWSILRGKVSKGGLASVAMKEKLAAFKEATLKKGETQDDKLALAKAVDEALVKVDAVTSLASAMSEKEQSRIRALVAEWLSGDNTEN